MSRVTAIISALVICIIVCLSWAVNHYRDNAITYKAQRDKNARELKLANSTITDMQVRQAAIESGRFHHDGNPIMTWCIGNVVGKNMPGNDDLVKPVKEQAENKIDGAVALIMAVGRAMLYEKEDTLSDHIESYGIRSL